MELSPEQVLLVGMIASAITFVLKLLADWFGFKPGRGPLTIVLYVVALGLSGLWTGVFIPQFPPSTDPVSFAGAVLKFIADLLAMAAPVVGLATLIYNLLYENVVVPLANKFAQAK